MRMEKGKEKGYGATAGRKWHLETMMRMAFFQRLDSILIFRLDFCMSASCTSHFRRIMVLSCRECYELCEMNYAI